MSRPQDTNLNLLLGTLWEIREKCRNANGAIARDLLAGRILDEIENTCEVLTPAVDLDKWDNDYLVTGHCPTCAQPSPVNDP